MVGSLYIVAAPSGGGKTSLIRAVTEALDNIEVSLSATTRSMRNGEREGVDYHYLTQEVFQEQIQANAFLEYAKVFDQYYGTPRAWIEERLNRGLDVFLDIDWQGARQIKTYRPDSVSIYLLPPSKETLLTRLELRNREGIAIIRERMQQTKEQVSHCAEFDYLLVNDNFEDTLQQLCQIVRVRRLRCANQMEKNEKLIESLLAD